MSSNTGLYPGLNLGSGHDEAHQQAEATVFGFWVFLMSDLIIFGTQNHGVPVMPEITGGRVSLVIFFYPDHDNLERRQWQTITDDGDPQYSKR